MSDTTNIDWIFEGLQYTFMHDSERVDLARVELAALKADAELGRLVRTLPLEHALLNNERGAKWEVLNRDGNVVGSSDQPEDALGAALDAANVR